MIIKHTNQTYPLNYIIVPGLKRLETKDELEHIIKVVCKYFCVKREAVFSKCRMGSLTRARHILRWFIVKRLDLTLAETGNLWETDHTTIMHSRNVVSEQLLAKHPNEYKKHIENIKKYMLCD